MCQSLAAVFPFHFTKRRQSSFATEPCRYKSRIPSKAICTQPKPKWSCCLSPALSSLTAEILGIAAVFVIHGPWQIRRHTSQAAYSIAYQHRCGGICPAACCPGCISVSTTLEYYTLQPSPHTQHLESLQLRLVINRPLPPHRMPLLHCRSNRAAITSRLENQTCLKMA